MHPTTPTSGTELLEGLDVALDAASWLPRSEWRKGLEDYATLLENCDLAVCDKSYALSLVWFHMPGHEREDYQRAEGYLTEALRVAPERILPRFYLGCLHFEFAEYREARRCLEGIQPGAFSRHDQEWRDLKVKEMLVCCQLALSPEQVTEGDLREILDVQSRKDDVFPLPTELVSTMVKMAGQNRSEAVRRLAVVLSRAIDEAGIRKLFVEDLRLLERELE